MAEEIEIGLSIASISSELKAAFEGPAKGAAGQMGSHAGGAGQAAPAGAQAEKGAEGKKGDKKDGPVEKTKEELKAIDKLKADSAAKDIAATKKVEAVKDQEAKKVIELEKKKHAAIKATIEANLSGTANLIGGLKQLAEESGAHGKLLKKLALAEIAVNTARAVMATLGTEGFFGIAQSVVVGAIGAMQLAKAAGEAFEEGGFPSGRNAMIRVNERGQEAVLNAQAVNTVGFGAINAMNNGISNQKTITNEISFSPTINIGGDAPTNLLSVLRQNKEEFARFFQEDVVRRGFLR